MFVFIQLMMENQCVSPLSVVRVLMVKHQLEVLTTVSVIATEQKKKVKHLPTLSRYSLTTGFKILQTMYLSYYQVITMFVDLKLVERMYQDNLLALLHCRTRIRTRTQIPNAAIGIGT